MPNDYETNQIRVHAQDLLHGGIFGNALTSASGSTGEPIAIQTPDGQLHSWFVPVAVDNQLAGFFRFMPDLTLMGYSSFQRRDESLEGCPTVESWTDPETIRRRAGRSARAGEITGAPVLTYDRAPARLAWAVPLTSSGGVIRVIFVAGQTVWEAPPTGDNIESYGALPPR